MKADKAEKSDVDAAVKILLDLKEQLGAATGETAAPSGGKKKKGKGGAPTGDNANKAKAPSGNTGDNNKVQTVPMGAAVNEEEVARLKAEVAKQVNIFLSQMVNYTAFGL